VHRWFAILVAVCLCSGARADEAAPPGVLLGTNSIDLSGESPYGPITWCGELLFVRTESGPELIDPETRAVLSRNVPEAVRREPYFAGLLECTKADEKTILWFDDGDASIIWQTVDGSDTGLVQGFHRSWFYGRPFLDLTDQTVAGVPAEDKTLAADRLPPGMKLLSVSPTGLQPPLTLEFVDDFALLKDDLVEIVTHRDAEIGTNRIIRQPQSGIVIVAQLDLRQTPPGIEHAVAIQDILPGSTNVQGPLVVASDGNVHFEMGEDAESKDCRLQGLSWGTPEIHCARLVQDKRPLRERVSERIGDESKTGTFVALSPSGHWVAWTKQVPIESDQDVGTVNVYLAPTADLLSP
jgi:hypothetical protein